MTRRDASRLRRVVLVGCLAWGCSTAAAASLHSQTMLATVSGVVLSSDDPGIPIRRATVSLLSADLRVPLSAVTDDRGRFAFTRVPAGHYGVVASKPAFVGAFYGSKRPGRGPGVPLAVPAGGRIADLKLTLTRGGVIAGSLRLPSGQPALNMPITVVEVETVGGVRRLRLTGGRTSTDDRGQYRVFGLPPGEYIVQAAPSGLIMGSPTGPNDAAQTTAAEVSWAQEQARGRVGGVAPVGGPSAGPPARGQTLNYATVYFPGTSDASASGTVQVGPGEERRGVDFALALVSTARVSGRVVAPDGQPLANVPVSIVAKDSTLNLRNLIAPRPAVRSGAEGRFVIPAVAPGRYQLVARAASSPSTAQGRTDLWAIDDLFVDGREIADVALALQPGMTVSGRVVFDAARSLPTPEQLAGARVTLTPATAGRGAVEAMVAGGASTSTPVAADGSFSVSGLSPDSYRVGVTMPGIRTSVSASAGTWSWRSLTVAGQDAADRTIEIRPREDARDLIVRFTDRPTELSGTLLDQAGRAAAAFPIVVFPTTRREWTSSSTRVAVARPSTDGTFRLVGLPPGQYFLCAAVSVDQADLDDTAFFEQLAAGAITITLTEGVALVQNLRVG